MSIHELFEGGEMKRNKSHFLNLIMIARADGVVAPEEQVLLNKMASNIGLSEEQVAHIMADPEKYPMQAPSDKEERLDRFVALIKMVAADNEIDEQEMTMLSRFSAGLGIEQDQAASMVNRVLGSLRKGMDHTAILEELMS